jgi:hypothetical protein
VKVKIEDRSNSTRFAGSLRFMAFGFGPKFRSFFRTHLLQLRFLFDEHVGEDDDQDFEGFLFAEARVAAKVLADATAKSY